MIQNIKKARCFKSIYTNILPCVSEPIMERFLAWSVFGLSLEYPGGLWLVVLYYHITYIHNTFFHSIFITHHIERFKI